MQKKDYEKIVKCIKDSTKFGEIVSIDFIIRLANLFKEDNERFDKVRFLTACGLSHNTILAYGGDNVYSRE